MKVILEDSTYKVEIEMTGGSEDLATATELAQVAGNAMGRLRVAEEADQQQFGFALSSELERSQPLEGQ